MAKILFALIILLFGFATAPAQNNDGNETKNVAADQSNYSESTPYQPRQILSTDSDKKKEKKSKKVSDEKIKVQTDPSNSSAITDSAKTVQIPVFVYDQKDQIVTNLPRSDFKILIDETEQEITAFETARQPLKLLLILDTSPSTANSIDGLKNFATKMIEALKPDDKLQIITFDSYVRVLNEPTNDAVILRKAVKKIEIGEGTAIYDSIQKILQKHVNPLNEKPTIILLTDGVDTTSVKSEFTKSLIEAEKSGTVIFPFYLDTLSINQKNPPSFPNSLTGIFSGSSRGMTEEEYEFGRAYLQDIAALSGGRTFKILGLSEIRKDDFETILKIINPSYYISIKSIENGAVFQRKQIKVRVNRPNLRVLARGSLITGDK